MDLVAVRLAIEPAGRGVVARDHHDHVYAAALGLLEILAPREAAVAHDAPRDKGLCASRLLDAAGRPLREGEPLARAAGWRLCGLTAEVSRMWALLAEVPPPFVRLGAAELRVSGAGVEAADGAEALRARWASAPGPEQVTLVFAAPTCFRTRGADGRQRAEVWPTPRLVFGGLARRWQRLTGLDALAPPEAWDTADATIEQWTGESVLTTLQRRPQRAFVGRFTYALPPDPTLCRAAALLADFATYAGVGARTGAGLGMLAPGEGDAC